MYLLKRLRPVSSNDLIRLGGNQDGGYVVNKRAIEKTKNLISIGVGTDWSFEKDFLLNKKGQTFRIDAYDFSVSEWNFIKVSLGEIIQILYLKNIIRHFTLFRFYLRTAINFMFFFRRRGIKFYQKGIDENNSDRFITFKEVMYHNGNKYHTNEIFVKMDIEGYEFKVLNQMLHYSEKITGFIVEFHDLDINGPKLELLLDVIFHNGYVVTHVHANNVGGYIHNTNHPRLMEVTFLKRDLLFEEELEKTNISDYPRRGLDFPCIKGIPELKIVFPRE